MFDKNTTNVSAENSIGAFANFMSSPNVGRLITIKGKIGWTDSVSSMTLYSGTIYRLVEQDGELVVYYMDPKNTSVIITKSTREEIMALIQGN